MVDEDDQAAGILRAMDDGDTAIRIEQLSEARRAGIAVVEVTETLSLRRREAERAEAIVATEAEKFHEWHASLDVVPAIASLRARAEEIREAELQKAEALLGRLDDSQRRAVEAVTAQIVNKLLHLPTVRMKQAAAAADGVVYAEAVRHLFGLEEEQR